MSAHSLWWGVSVAVVNKYGSCLFQLPLPALRKHGVCISGDESGDIDTSGGEKKTVVRLHWLGEPPTLLLPCPVLYCLLPPGRAHDAGRSRRQCTRQCIPQYSTTSLGRTRRALV